MADKVVVYSVNPYLALKTGGEPLDPLGVTITDQPDDVLNLPEPDGTSFTVVATSGDASPLTYQWQIFDGLDWVNVTDGGIFSGATTATLTLSSTNPSAAGIYRCIVTNDVNSRTSNNAFLSLLAAVTFINGPVTPWDAVVGVETTRGPASDFFTGGQTPFTYAESGTAWPLWANLDPNTGIITGTPDVESVTNGMSLTATDTGSNTAVSNTFSLTVVAAQGAITFNGPIPDIFGEVGVPITPINTAVFFSGTQGPFSYSKVGPWPVSLDLDPVTGVISGTPLEEGTVTGLQVLGTDTTPDTAISNLFDGTTDADAALIFRAELQNSLTPSIAAGSPTPTFVRADPRTIIDYQGALKTVPAGAAGFMGARQDAVDPAIFYNTLIDGTTLINSSNSPNSPYVDADGPYGFISEVATTNLALWNRDYTNAVWAKTSVTAALDATGIDGAANSASTLTSTDLLSTILQTVTSASANRTFSVAVRRKTGTGTVSITTDGGSTWTAINNDINAFSYTRVSVTGGAVTNPVFGFQFGLSGDEIEVDYSQLENADFPSTYIKTEGTAVPRAGDVLTYPDAGNLNAVTGTAKASAWVEGLDGGNAHVICRTSFDSRILKNRSDLLNSISSSVSSTANGPFGSPALNVAAVPIQCSWGGNLTVEYNGIAGTPTAYASMGSGPIGIGTRANGSEQWGGTVRFVEIYDEEGK